jgi:hypothetical protein
MLELRVTGDEHPKTFTLVTDDGNAELVRLQEIIHDEIGADEEDPLRRWFDTHTADQFKEGVAVPSDLIGDFGEVIEGEWWEEAEKIDKERQDALDKLEAGHDG